MSSKAKAKKEQRLKETKELNERKALIDNANKVTDYLAGFDPFRKYEREGLQLDIETFGHDKLTDELHAWMFKLAKENMQDWYKQTWGWNDSMKFNELKDDDAKFLVAYDRTTKQPKAFMHFRFVFEDEQEVLYVYELQTVSDIRSKGVGKFLMKLSELIAIKYCMKKVMLTCFICNQRALQFYLSKLNYEIDEISPSKSIEETSIVHEILCKRLPQKQK